MAIFDLVGFFLILFLFGFAGLWRSRQIVTRDAYLLANRHTGLFGLVATLVMTELNTSTLISFSAAGFLAGDWAIVLPLIFLVGLTFYALTVAKKYRRRNVMSVAEIFRDKYGTNYARAVSLCLIVAMVGFSATYIRSMTLFFAPLLRINLWGLSLLLTLAIAIFTVRGGLVAIIRSDIVSFLLVIFLLPLTYFWTYTFKTNANLVPLSLAQGQEFFSSSYVLSLMVLTSFTYILAPWYGQKIFSAKNERVAYWSVALSAVLVFVLYGIVTLACSLLQKKGLKLSSPESALPFILSNIVPIGARGITYAVIFSIGATTLSGVWSAMTSMVISDFYSKESSSVKNPIMITLLFAAICLILANTMVDNVFNKLILANIPVFALSFSLLAAFYWPKVTSMGAYASSFVGLAWGIFCYRYFGEDGGYTMYWAFFGLPLIFLTGISVSLFTRSLQIENA